MGLRDGEAGDATITAAPGVSFEIFVAETEPRLRAALIALYGTEDGRDATAEALAYAWEHWEHLSQISNVPGYLFRVAQSRSRRRRSPVLFVVPEANDHAFEPRLPEALRSLSDHQRLCVVLVHGFAWSTTEVAELIGVQPTTVRNHLERGLRRLRKSLGVENDAR